MSKPIPNNQRVEFKRTTKFTGRNGYIDCTGLDIQRLDHNFSIMLTPLTSRDALGHCDIEIPREALSKLIVVLQKLRDMPADAEAFMRLYPASERNTNCLENIACINCGNREKFNINATITAEVDDEGTDNSNTDTEWDDKSPCSCGQCDSSGTVADFTIEGLDDAIAKAEEAADKENKEEPTS